MIYEWLDASRKNPVLMDPIDYVMYKTAKDAYTEGKSLVKNVKEKDWDAVSYKAGAGCLFIAEAGIASYASKAVFTKFKSPVGSKNALLDEPSINTSNFNFNKTTNPIKSKFFANQKATISRILSDETGAVGIGKNKNVGGVKGVAEANENIVYRAINPKDTSRLNQGLSLEAKNPEGAWKLDEHLIGGSGKASWANDPFISTTTDIDVARGFNQSGSNLGIVKIDLNKVSSQALKGYEVYPRINGVEGLPYHYSIWQQEVSVYKNIPNEAIRGFVKW